MADMVTTDHFTADLVIVMIGDCTTAGWEITMTIVDGQVS